MHEHSTLKAGDTVVCISDCPHGDYTVGSHYYVVAYDGRTMYDSIKDNKGGLRIANHDEIRPYFRITATRESLGSTLDTAIRKEVEKLTNG